MMRSVNVPNALTVVRIALVPALIWALLGRTDMIAAVVFAVASGTDMLDGYLARRNDLITTFGKFADPIADKLLIISALVVLVSLDRLAAWIAIVIIAREFAVTVLRAAAGSQGLVIAADRFGKIKTVLQVGMVLALILDSSRPAWIYALVYLTLLITLLSGANYLRAAPEVARQWGAPEAR
jgi:CDP-diacylglycerol--glycerol-3-phosphate 3-phosphatidyltransferase